MKRLIIIFLLLASIGNTASKLYIGNDDTGRIIAGIEASVKIGDLVITSEACSFGIDDLLPEEITYIQTLEINGLGYEHSCTHQIDRPDIKQDTINKVYFKWNY